MGSFSGLLTKEEIFIDPTPEFVKINRVGVM